MTTKFFNLEIKHPHSGKATRSEIETALRAKAYNPSLKGKELAEHFKKNGVERVLLEDVNGGIRVACTVPNGI